MARRAYLKRCLLSKKPLRRAGRLGFAQANVRFAHNLVKRLPVC